VAQPHVNPGLGVVTEKRIKEVPTGNLTYRQIGQELKECALQLHGCAWDIDDRRHLPSLEYQVEAFIGGGLSS